MVIPRTHAALLNTVQVLVMNSCTISLYDFPLYCNPVLSQYFNENCILTNLNIVFITQYHGFRKLNLIYVIELLSKHKQNEQQQD